MRQIARDLDLTETAVRKWVKRSQVDRGKGPPGALTTAGEEELARLRKENRELREDREILRNDNAAMESWFSTLKSELGERFESHRAAKEQLFDYIEVFYPARLKRSWPKMGSRVELLRCWT